MMTWSASPRSLPPIAALVFVGMLAHPGAQPRAQLLPRNLTVEAAPAPDAVDVGVPRFGWVLAATDSSSRALRQLGYQLRVAQDRAALADGRAPLWDSGRVASGATTFLPYDGRVPLTSDTDYWWTVRVWDQDGQSSAWAEPVRFRTGLLHASDWRARWIEHPEPVVSGHNGYRSTLVSSADTEQWVALDMYRPVPIDQLRLHPSSPVDLEPRVQGYLFPEAFRVETAGRADFSDATIVGAWARGHSAWTPTEPLTLDLTPSTGQYLRLVVTKLAPAGSGTFGFALAELEALGGGKRYSRASGLTASHPGNGGLWALGHLLDTVLVSQPSNAGLPGPSPYFRHRFQARGTVVRARAFVASLGLYDLYVNGESVGPNGLSTDWTNYHRRVQYRAFDITPYVRAGSNAVGLVLGDGWYAGRLAFLPGRRHYGDRPRVLAQLHITYEDGSREVIVSDATWQTTREGPILSSDLFDGEVQDARRDLGAWSTADFDASAWKAARESSGVTATVVAQTNPPIVVTQELTPVSIVERAPRVYQLDFGQNLVGRVRARIRGAAGTRVELRHAEMLEPDGRLYIENLRLPVLGTRASDTFVLAGTGEWETFEPRFTFHGFRYVEVTGLKAAPTPDMFVARVLHSDIPLTGTVSTSSPLIDRLMEAIWWTQRGNFVGIPTDCPQRGERAGWMGDAQVFAQAAMYNADVLRFFDKWLVDVRDAQGEGGGFSAVSPAPGGASMMTNTPGWSDAGTIVPWFLWVNYGDRRVLERHLDAAMRFVDGIARENPDGVWRHDAGTFFGDWLNADLFELEGWPKTGAMPSPAVFATAYFARSAELVSKMAAALGRTRDAARYARLATHVRESFANRFITPDGRIVGGPEGTTPQFAFGAGETPAPETQAAYAMALQFDMVPESRRAQAFAHLERQLAKYDGRLSTGIQATLPAMLALVEGGRLEEAYRLLQRREPGTWGYMLDQGATTIWERWDGYVEGRGFHRHEMNSFNHYAMGSIGEWIWRHVIGLAPDPERPGYESFIVAPRPGGGLTHAQGRYASIRGPIEVQWRVEGARFFLDLEVPPNTTASVRIPGRLATTTEGDSPLSMAVGIERLREEADAIVVRVGSGRYHFVSEGRDVQ